MEGDNPLDQDEEENGDQEWRQIETSMGGATRCHAICVSYWLSTCS